jgi:hypothetical protein
MSLFIWKTSPDFEPPFLDISNPLNFMADFTFLTKEKIRILIEIGKNDRSHWL